MQMPMVVSDTPKTQIPAPITTPPSRPTNARADGWRGVPAHSKDTEHKQAAQENFRQCSVLSREWATNSEEVPESAQAGEAFAPRDPPSRRTSRPRIS